MLCTVYDDKNVDNGLDDADQDHLLNNKIGSGHRQIIIKFMVAADKKRSDNTVI